MKRLIVAACGAIGLAASMAAFAPAGHTTTCLATITAHTLTITGTTATGTFTVAGAGCELKVGLASYKAANGQAFPANLPQTLFDAKVGVFGPGSYTVTVGVPDCFAQTDLFTGDVIEALAVGNVYGARLLDARLSGSGVCAAPTTTTPTTTTTSTTTVTTPPVTTTVTPPAPPPVTVTVSEAAPAPVTVTTPAVTVTTPASPARTVTVKTPPRTVTVTRTVVKPCPKPKAKTTAKATCPKGAHPVKDKRGKWHCAYEANG